MARISAALVFVVGAAIGVAATAAVQRGSGGRAKPPAISIPESRRSAIVTAAQRVSPAVVSVSVMASRTVRVDPFGGMFRDDFFDRFFPPSEYRERVPGLGSGVIVDRHGVVLTNSHVIRDAEEIRVNLPDGRHFAARVLGDSPVYDLAVLQMEDPKDLPVAPLGNSDSLVVGEWAIAIGNPFGYLLNDSQPTVTAGVVSATKRDIKSEASQSGVYKNMIQTDAAINPGNSGGALVNGEGQVIGINAFIFTQGGGSIGLGFAIPINLAKRLLEEIQTHGRVRSAWPGMQVQPVTEYIARRLGWRELGGLVVTRVAEGGPAGRAGLRPGDRIRRVNDRVTDSLDDVQGIMYGAGVGDVLTLDVERDGRSFQAKVTLVEAPRSER